MARRQPPHDRDHVTRLLVAFLFYLGVLVGLALAAAAAWADFEGLSYYATGAGYRTFSGLDCPVLMSSWETGVLTAHFENTGSQKIEPYYEIEISGATASRHLEGQVAVPPHGQRDVAWTTDSRDVDLGYFVFAKLDILPVAGLPTRETTCGILVAEVPGLSGTQILSAALLISALCMIAGLLWPAIGFRLHREAAYDGTSGSNGQRPARALGLATAFGILAALGGWWLLALILMAISLLLLLISIRYLLS